MQPRILIAEGDESVRRMISRVLEIAGYVTLQSASWRETTARHATGRPFLILLDLELLPPGGWRALRQLQQAADPTPVIGVTAWPYRFPDAHQWGLETLMEKPLDLGLLLQKIEQTLKRAIAVPS